MVRVKVLGNTGNYRYVRDANRPYGLCMIYNSRTGEIMHVGSRKHCTEVWNTRYNYRSARYGTQ